MNVLTRGSRPCLFIQGNSLKRTDQEKSLCWATISKESWVLFKHKSVFSFPGELRMFPIILILSSSHLLALQEVVETLDVSKVVVVRQAGGALLRRLLNYTFCQPRELLGSQVRTSRGPSSKVDCHQVAAKVTSSCISCMVLLLPPSFKILDYGLHRTGLQASL